MSKLSVRTVTINGSEFLNLGTGTVDKKGHYDGLTIGVRKRLLLARYLRQEGAEMFIAELEDGIDTSATVDPTHEPTPTASVPTPAPVKAVATLTPIAPTPAASVPTPVKPPVPVPNAKPPVPVPTASPSHSLDYCPNRVTHKGLIMGLRDGVVYRWFAPTGDTPHYRRYKGRDITPASFETPTAAPTVSKPAVKVPTVPNVPIAPCETLPKGVLDRFERNGVIVTLYLPLPGETYMRATVSPLPVKV